MFHTICENTDFFRYFCKRFSPFWAKRNGLDNILTDNMLDFNTIETDEEAVAVAKELKIPEGSSILITSGDPKIGSTNFMKICKVVY